MTRRHRPPADQVDRALEHIAATFFEAGRADAAPAGKPVRHLRAVDDQPVISKTRLAAAGKATAAASIAAKAAVVGKISLLLFAAIASAAALLVTRDEHPHVLRAPVYPARPAVRSSTPAPRTSTHAAVAPPAAARSANDRHSSTSAAAQTATQPSPSSVPSPEASEHCWISVIGVQVCT